MNSTLIRNIIRACFLTDQKKAIEAELDTLKTSIVAAVEVPEGSKSVAVVTPDGQVARVTCRKSVTVESKGLPDTAEVDRIRARFGRPVTRWETTDLDGLLAYLKGAECPEHLRHAFENVIKTKVSYAVSFEGASASKKKNA